MKNQKPTPSNNQLLLKYAGFATQLLVSLALAVFIGFKIDKWLRLSTPLAVWILPLAVIIVIIYRVIKDTSKNKNV